MRSDKPKRGLLIAVLLLLAAFQIAAGTFAMVMYREYMESPSDVTVEDEKTVQDENVTDDPGATVPEKDQTDEEDEDDPEEEDDEDKDDEDKDYVVMIVQASDNFAAVRTGRGVEYDEVGRITNGHKVALTDLKDGWYKIAKGEYKGYYTHESSYVAE